MNTKFNRDKSITITWNTIDKVDVKKALATVDDLLKKGYALQGDGMKSLKSKGACTLLDTLASVLRIRELSSIMMFLQDLGLLPSLYALDGKRFRFRIDDVGVPPSISGRVKIKKDWYADHKIPDEAAAKAVEKWISAGRPM